MAHQFDELSKALASGVPRREVLKRFGGGLVGAVLASLGVGQASAAPNQCAVTCSVIFAPGPARAACKQACEQCARRGQVFCFGFSFPPRFTCCPQGTSCCDSQCC